MTLPYQRRKRTVRWEVASASDDVVSRLQQTHALHPVIARVLAARGFDAGDAVLSFLDPTLRHLRAPDELAGMDRLVERLLRAVHEGEKLCVYGDYDVDGVTSTAIMVETLRYVGADPIVVIPNRFLDGYGMNSRRIRELAAEGVRVIVTVDNGVSAHGPITEANALGIDVLVTDHHLPSEELPPAYAIVNPNAPGAVYPHGRLCGAGVAFKVSHALLRASGRPPEECREFLRSQLDLVALGTIQDVAPLMGENRVLTRAGLQVLAETRRPGLRALLEKARYRRGGPPDATTVAFGLGPRINAAGRTQDARIAFDLLLCEDEATARSLAAKLDDMNRDRQEIERAILDASLIEAEHRLTRFGESMLVVSGEQWHTGVIGIVASRLTERYDVPAIVLCVENGLAKGSARSVAGFDIHEALVACSRHLEAFGGHASAAGLQVKLINLPSFREQINAYSAEKLAERGDETVVAIDAEVKPGELEIALCCGLQRLQPFGEGNREPVFLMRGLRSSAPPRAVGKGDTAKLRLSGGGRHFPAVGFRMGDRLAEFESDGFDVLFRPSINEYFGEPELQMQIIDVRQSA